MLSNLNPTTFEPFGTIEKDGIGGALSRLDIKMTKIREIRRSRFNFLFVHPTEKVAIDIVEGNAIIFVGTSPQELTAFLLDATVVINPGICFYVIPLINTAVISVAQKDGIQTVKAKVLDRPLNILPYIEPSEIYTFFYHKKEKGFVFKGEKHDFWELTYVDKGELFNVVDGKEYKLAKGEAMFFSPNQYHEQYASRDVSVCYITVSFKLSDIDPDLLADKIFARDNEVSLLMKKMTAESSSGKIFSDDLMLSYLKEVIIILAREKHLENAVTKELAPIKKSVEHSIVFSAEQYIKKNLSKRITVSEIAKSIPVSESYLSVLFKKKTGKTVNAYITEKKMELAKKYIEKKKYTITEIALMTGYNNIHYFSSAFKKSVGISPTEYAMKKDREE